MVIYTAIHIPLAAAFSLRMNIILYVKSVENVDVLMVVSFLVDCMFVLDIIINFR